MRHGVAFRPYTETCAVDREPLRYTAAKRNTTGHSIDTLAGNSSWCSAAPSPPQAAALVIPRQQSFLKVVGTPLMTGFGVALASRPGSLSQMDRPPHGVMGSRSSLRMLSDALRSDGFDVVRPALCSSTRRGERTRSCCRWLRLVAVTRGAGVRGPHH
jgi:hypothetical protein